LVVAAVAGLSIWYLVRQRLAVSRTAADRPMLAPEDEFAASLYCVIFATFLKSFRRPQ
jgi:hypothetical protein